HSLRNLILSQARLPIPPQGHARDHTGGPRRVNPRHGIDIGGGAGYADCRRGAPMPKSVQGIVHDEPIAAAAIAVALCAMATLLGAWFFQYALGYDPCPLCLQQRIPYYITIPLAVIVAAGALKHWPRQWLAAGLVVIALAML